MHLCMHVNILEFGRHNATTPGTSLANDHTHIQFRLCVLAYRCLHGSAPQYVAETLHLTSDTEACRRLRSGSTLTLFVPATSAIMEHSAYFPVNSFILPNFSLRTQELSVQHFISRQLNCLCDFVKWPCSY